MTTKHLIILVHGMGKHTDNWADQYGKQLELAYNQYKTLRLDPFANVVEVKSVRYDDVFEARRSAWSKRSKQILEVLTANGLSDSLAGELLEATQDLGNEGFLRTHVLDVLLYRFLPTIAEQVRVRVMKQILSHVKSAGPGDVHYSILAHSLGTAVVADALHLWMRGGLALPKKGFALTLRPDNVFMIANCSRVLWNNADIAGTVYQSELRPFPAETKGACGYYGNYVHSLDPVTQVKPFDPPDRKWLFEDAIPSEVFRAVHILAEDVTDINVHALEHYLAHPCVHVDIFRRVRNSLGVVTEQEYSDALRKYYATTLVGKKLVEARKKLSDYTLPDTGTEADHFRGLLKFLREPDFAPGGV